MDSSRSSILRLGTATRETTPMGWIRRLGPLDDVANPHVENRASFPILPDALRTSPEPLADVIPAPRPHGRPVFLNDGHILPRADRRACGW